MRPSTLPLQLEGPRRQAKCLRTFSPSAYPMHRCGKETDRRFIATPVAPILLGFTPDRRVLSRRANVRATWAPQSGATSAPFSDCYREQEMLAPKSPTGKRRMDIIRLSAMAALGFALLIGNALAQQPNITVPPPPSTPVTPGVAPLRSQIQPPLPPLGTGVVVPIPLPTPQLLPSGSAFTSCTSICDTQAMNCQANCVPVTGSAAASLAAPAGATSSCNLSCASQQLVCKQSCGLGQ